MIETVPSGTVLHGRYRIERVLGSGGFGHVYLAQDLTTNQQSAVKEYLVTGASGQEQLKHEARVLSQLHHPNLPAFLDTFIEHGRYYVVLSYIEGEDLTDLVRLTRQRNGVIPIPQILGWIVSICDGVMFMHSQQPIVIHRDIKPDNIRITPNGTAVLVDLGNAKATADGARTLFFIRHQGTPGYAPPEQYPGGTGTDARSDVYALGGTLYFALTATEPPSVSTRNQSIQQGTPDIMSLQDQFANNPPEESAEAQAARQFRLGVTKPAKPAPRHSNHIAQLGTLSPEILHAINHIIMKAMALRPKDRYQYVADFANDLKSIITALPQPPSPNQQKDPNSTQPNLAEMYDALQTTRDNANPANPPMTPPPSNSPRGAMAPCPRCQNPLAPNAVFCPQCGLSLPNAQRGTGNANHQPNNNSQPPTFRASTQMAQADQTLVISQEQVRQTALSLARQSNGAMQTPQPQNYPYQAGNSYPGQQAQSFQSTTITPSINPDQQQAPHIDEGTSRWLIYGAIALIIVLVLLAFMLLHH